MNMVVILFRTLNHMNIMMRKRGSMGKDLVKESSIKVIDAHRDTGKARLIITIRIF
jgi:hypothetical protein